MFQSLIAENKWAHKEIWNRIATSAPRLLLCPADDPLGPGIAVDETAQLKRGHHTVATGIQWAGCVRPYSPVRDLGVLQLCHTPGRDLDHSRPVPPKKDWFTGTGETSQARRAAAGIPDETVFETKPQIAHRAFHELRDLGVCVTWATGDDVYGRYADLRKDHEENGEAYAYFVPKDFRISTTTGHLCRADELATRAQGHFEIRSAGPGRTGPRWSEWAMIDLGAPEHFLLIRRPVPPRGKHRRDHHHGGEHD